MLNRADLRAFVTTKLKTGTTAAGQNVFNTRVTALFENELPALNVYILDQELDKNSPGYSKHHKVYRATLMVWAKVVASSTENIADKLDDLCEQIEDLMEPDPTLGGRVTVCEHDRTEMQFDPDVPIGDAQLFFTLQFTKNKKPVS